MRALVAGILTDEDGPDGEGHTLGINVGRILVVQHVVGGRDRSVLVTDDGELQFSTRDVVDVLVGIVSTSERSLGEGKAGHKL